VYWGDTLALQLPDAATDPRTPDIIVQPELGVIYAERQSTKLAEHGGQFDEDTNVALLVSAPAVRSRRISAAVQTTQVAPTILKLLGLDPQALAAVKAEGTAALPGF
jgi:arylsulfatase A-like enzyme